MAILPQLGRLKGLVRFRRQIIQLLAALLMNLNLPGFASGQISNSASKAICALGLNCYSCPGAVLSCPIGTLSTSLGALQRRLPFYLLGTLLAFGALLGRRICGWLCPFGLVQELLAKLPLPKLPKSRWTRRLTWGKYLVLVGLVLAAPLIIQAVTGVATPAFCAWLCPAGTLSAGIPLVILNPALRYLIGVQFGIKVGILLVLLVACLFIYRPFCRWLCPLGALLSFFNGVALLRYRVSSASCTNCGACVQSCKMDVQRVSDRECIQCGACVTVCPEQAICGLQKTLRSQPIAAIKPEEAQLNQSEPQS